MPTSGPRVTVRAYTQKQYDRHVRAATKLHWSLNRFYIEAAELLAKNIEASENPVEQLMVKTDRPSLNQ